MIARDGTPLVQRAYGLADRESGLAAAADMRFNLGSINKIFTKVAIGQLLAAGKLALTDTVGALLPDYPDTPARRATVDQLLNHRGGVADFFGPAFDAAPKDRFRANADYYRFVAGQPVRFEPGARQEYSTAATSCSARSSSACRACPTRPTWPSASSRLPE